MGLRLAPALLAVMLSVCTMPESTSRIVHPNGLSLALPASLSAEQRPEGFRIDAPAARNSRAPLEITVSVHPGAEKPDGAWPSTRSVGGRRFSYRVDQDEGGSGGDFFLLSAWTPFPGGYVLVRQEAQAEPPATPDFAQAWSVMESLVPPSR